MINGPDHECKESEPPIMGTKNSNSWQGLPYYPISQFYHRQFGQKVYKIPVSVFQTCPNREGLKGMKTCIFCDVWGSAAYPERRDMELKDQIGKTMGTIRKRFKAQKFLVYFQAYTNTFTRTTQLRKYFEVAVECEDVVGMVVATRPDCLSHAVLDLWNEYSKKTFLAVELGVQSFDDDQLLWMRRGHTCQQSIDAIYKIKRQCDVDLGLHLIFGFPGETKKDLVEAAKLVSSLSVDNVKLHNLHVLKGTPLGEQYLQGDFSPLGRKEYIDRTILFLQHLSPKIAVHRLAAVASRHEELMAPRWAKSKMETYQLFLDEFSRRNAYQGQHSH